MPRTAHMARPDRVTRFLTQFNDQTSDGDDDAGLVIPEDLTDLSDAELTELHAQAVAAFSDLYGDGSDVSAAALETLAPLTEGITALSAEQETRAAAAGERAEQARALAAQAGIALSSDDDDASGDGDKSEDSDGSADEDGDDADGDGDQDGDDAAGSGDGDPAPVTAAAPRRRPLRIPVARPGGQILPAVAPTAAGVLTASASPAGSGYRVGDVVTFDDLAAVIDRHTASMNHGTWAAATRAKRPMAERFPLATMSRGIPEQAVIQDPRNVDQVEAAFAYATDEKRLKGGSLIAAGGWCAPSTILYDDWLDLEGTGGLLSLPEVGANVTGGIMRPKPESFAAMLLEDLGWDYSEEEDIDGDYDGEGGGSKPCVRPPCPEWEEIRLRIEGLCIQAGLLQRRGAPESIRRFIRRAILAWEHHSQGRLLARMVAGSTAVTMPSGTAGSISPLLSAIEKQVTHFRYQERMNPNATLEAVFPLWVLGALRADISYRNGDLDVLSVTDAQIRAWFAARGVNPQFVYNWQDITGAATAFTTWQTSVQFLLYPAGGWRRISTEVLTLETLYDSTLLGTNDYTALWTEAGYALDKRGESRVVTVPLEVTGTTGYGKVLTHEGLKGA